MGGSPDVLWPGRGHRRRLLKQALRARRTTIAVLFLPFADPLPAPLDTLVDVGGYRAEAREALIQKAHDAAEKVRRRGDVLELEPMNAFDRRVIHHALKDDPGVETHSVEVEGTSKKAILLRPKSSG